MDASKILQLPIDILKEVKKSGADQDDRLWFLATITLTSILIIFLSLLTKFFYDFLKDDKENKKINRETLTELKETVKLLKKDLDYHREDIDKNSKDIEDLKKRRR